ncbi:polysaccharide deacetylase family protein [Exiguobacterium flavidum]|uniref:polysaccharide deacetylase family protein n=1 Tax=Exiguobacterium flavidum TaxID=2184695 RepID=UPI000DF86A08|nr:polysaccharide deacetylase family protein [Exiguobacterium flavidum]
MKGYTIPLLLLVVAGLFAFKWATLEGKTEDVDASAITSEQACLGLNYHRIQEPTFWNRTVERLTASDELKRYTVYTDEFEQQIKAMKDRGVKFVSESELEDHRKTGTFPDRCVWLSFDDGDETLVKNAYPVLRENDVPFSVFLIAGHVGAEDFQNMRLAGWAELREMQESGLVTFGSHTFDMHYLKEDKAVFLDEEGAEKFAADLERSRTVMKRELGAAPLSFAYPFGNADAKTTQIVEQTGFKTAFILNPSAITQETNAFYQNRVLVDSETFTRTVLPWIEQQTLK